MGYQKSREREKPMIEVTAYIEVEGYEFHSDYIIDASENVLNTFDFVNNLAKEVSKEELDEFLNDWYLPMKELSNYIIWSYNGEDDDCL